MDRKLTPPNATNGVTALLTLQTMFVIIASILSFLFVEFMSRYVYNSDGYNIWGHAFGIIIPMCVLVGAINFYIAKLFLRSVSTLISGIGSIANGDFSTRLDPKKAGALKEVYLNFNKMGEELCNVELLKNDFLNSYSHEFKTPITSINGFAELLLSETVSDSERAEYLQIIADESARLAQLADSAILMSKLDSQQIVSSKTLYSLDEQLRKCAILTSKAWQAKNIDFECKLTPLEYDGNSQLMLHLWLNLINNAIKYTPQNGKIIVSLELVSDKITVSITDNGIGMDEDTLNHLYEKYYQKDNSHTRQGLGLGLAIAQKVATLVGANISVTSELNKGSTFTVTL